jgi:hypothetical protein
MVSLVSEVAAALYREEKPIRMPVMSGARNVPRLGLCSSPSNVNERACIVPRRIAVCPPTGQLLDDSPVAPVIFQHASDLAEGAVRSC